MTAVLANIGYAFAQVTPIPIPDQATSATVGINFFVNPGKRVYVRHIIFKGNAIDPGRSHAPRNAPARRRVVFAGRDRSFEGAPAAPGLLQESRDHDAASARARTTRSTSIVTVEETTSGSFTFGLGYSQVKG